MPGGVRRSGADSGVTGHPYKRRGAGVTAHIPKNLSLQKPLAGVECEDTTGHLADIGKSPDHHAIEPEMLGPVARRGWKNLA